MYIPVIKNMRKIVFAPSRKSAKKYYMQLAVFFVQL